MMDLGQVEVRAVWAWTIHFEIEALPLKPGVNCTTDENASMFDKANFVGGSGITGLMPD